jgi:hypothetical protein
MTWAAAASGATGATDAAGVGHHACQAQP